MSDIEIHHLAAAYALDALDARERLAFEAHFATCAMCRTEVREFRESAGDLAGLAATAPSSGLRDRVLSEVAVTRQLSPLPSPVVRLADRRRSRPAVALAAVAAAAVFFVLGALVVGDGRDGGIGGEVAELVIQPDVRIAQLTGDVDGRVTVVWTEDRAAVVGTGLAAAGDGQAYELWLIGDDGTPVPMRLLDPADDGELEAVLPVDGDPVAWGVTLEPDTGSSAPTTPILFAASV